MTQATELLPDSWAYTTLGEIAEINPSSTTVTADDEQAVTFLPMAAVAELSGNVDLSRQRAFGEVRKGFTRFRDGDLLFAKITPCMENGKTAVVRGLLGGIGCGSTEFHVLRPAAGVHADYLRYFVVRSAFRQEARRNMQGAVGQQRVPVEFLRKAELPLAPTAEQQRIVSKIDELFSRIDEGERALERVQKLVERYRQSILKAAVTGELTRDWREKNKGKFESGEALLARILKARADAWEKAELDKMKAKGITPTNDKWKQRYDEPSLPRNIAELPPIPKGWCWATVDALCLVTKLAGFEYTKYVTYDNLGDLAVLKAENAGPFGFRPTVYSHVRSESVANLTRSAVEAGDLLMVFVGAGTGNVATVPDDQKYFLGPNIGMIRPMSLLILREYLEHYLRSPVGNRLTLSFAKAVAQPSLSMGAIRQIAVAVPPLDEQKAIADRIRRATSLADVAAEDIKARFAGSRALRGSILRKAFSGHLVTQVLSDQPASTLIEYLPAAQATAAARIKSRSGRE